MFVISSDKTNFNTSAAANQPASTAPPPFIGLTRRGRTGELSAIYVSPQDISVVEPSPWWDDGARVYLRTVGPKAIEIEESADSVLKLIEEHTTQTVKES
jgi:hypothetical protein